MLIFFNVMVFRLVFRYTYYNLYHILKELYVKSNHNISICIHNHSLNELFVRDMAIWSHVSEIDLSLNILIYVTTLQY